MPFESRSFLRDRASTETNMAALANCGPSALSHSHLARLYVARCIEAEDDAEECVGCDMGEDCLRLQAERPV